MSLLQERPCGLPPHSNLSTTAILLEDRHSASVRKGLRLDDDRKTRAGPRWSSHGLTVRDVASLVAVHYTGRCDQEVCSVYPCAAALDSTLCPALALPLRHALETSAAMSTRHLRRLEQHNQHSYNTVNSVRFFD